ncbi:MAG: AbrB/MazE/SpoVT family DNA-binding domain-containing protein [bacterium]
MPTIKVSAGHKVQLPKSFLSKYRVKVGDLITIREVNGHIILEPLKAKPVSKDVGTKQIRDDAKKADRDREEWLDFVAQAFDRSFGDEPAFTSVRVAQKVHRG